MTAPGPVLRPEAGSGGEAGAEFGAGCFAPHLQTWGFRRADGEVLPAGAVSGKVVTLRAADGTVYEAVRVTGYRWGPGQPGIVVAGGTLARDGAGRQEMEAPAVVPIAEVESGRVHQSDEHEQARRTPPGPA